MSLVHFLQVKSPWNEIENQRTPPQHAWDEWSWWIVGVVRTHMVEADHPFDWILRTNQTYSGCCFVALTTSDDLILRSFLSLGYLGRAHRSDFLESRIELRLSCFQRDYIPLVSLQWKHKYRGQTIDFQQLLGGKFQEPLHIVWFHLKLISILCAFFDVRSQYILLHSSLVLWSSEYQRHMKTLIAIWHYWKSSFEDLLMFFKWIFSHEFFQCHVMQRQNLSHVTVLRTTQSFHTNDDASRGSHDDKKYLTSRRSAPLNLFIRITAIRAVATVCRTTYEDTALHAVALMIKNISCRIAPRHSIFSYELPRFAPWLRRTVCNDTEPWRSKISHVASPRAAQSLHKNYGASRRGYVALPTTTRRFAP